MKISTLTENPTIASAPTNSSQAPEFGRSDKFLEEKEEQIDETTSGSVATVATPVGDTQRRAKGSMFSGIKTSKKFANSTGVNEAYGRYGRRDAYQRDYDSSVSGMGKHDSLAYKLDGGANDEGWDEPQRSYQSRPAAPVKKGYYFYNVPADQNEKAQEVGLFRTKTGKWYSPFQNTRADMFFGKARYWEPKNESISEAESTTDNLRSWQVVIMNNYYRGKYSDYSGRYYYVLASSPQEAKQVVLDNADGILQDLLSMKSHNGRKILPRSSAVRITADRIGKIEDGTVSGRMSTTRYRPMFSPQGVMMVKLTNGAIEDVQEQDVAEAYQFKGPFPFDVDHMHGGRGINLPSAPTKKFFTDKKQWERAVNDINSSKYDDNSDYIGVTGRSTVEINGREWARWSDAQQKGYIELSSMSEQGVAEGLGTTPKITFAQQTPGSWTRIDILVDGDVKFQAVKTMGPGHWTIHDQDGEVIGSGGNKTELKASVLNYLSKQGVAEGQLDEISAATAKQVRDKREQEHKDLLNKTYGNAQDPQVRHAQHKLAKAAKSYFKRGAKKGVAEEQVNEKSKSQAQFRTMAAVAHNPKFAKKVGISPEVGKEFHSADRKQNYKDLPKEVDEEKQRLDPKCWSGYKKQGTKMKGGTRVNNCVKVDETELNEEDMLAQSLYKALDLFKKAADRELGAKPKDKGVQKKVDEVSSELLGRYKKGASAQSSQLDKEAFAGAPDAKQKIEKSNKRYSGIIKATKKQFANDAKGVAENFNGEYDDEAGSAESNLLTTARAVKGLLDTIDDRDNLPEWVQEKIAKAEQMLVTSWDYLQSQEEQGVDPQIDEMFDMIEEMVESLAQEHGVDSEVIWEDFESVPDKELFETAAWRRKEGKNKNGGLNAKGVASYRRENPGSKLQTAVTTKPSKLKKGSKAAKRRKSFCARMGGMKGPMKDENGKPTRKALALRKWNC